MDKLAYHLNKKKKRAKTEGEFLYYYPCNSEDKDHFHIYDKRYIEIEVTENEWEALRELDRFEYNNWHRVYRHNETCLNTMNTVTVNNQGRMINNVEDKRKYYKSYIDFYNKNPKRFSNRFRF